jgi:integrase/recombinase XerC
MTDTRHTIVDYLQSVKAARSPRTYTTYSQGLRAFVNAVGITAPLTTETYIAFLKKIAGMNPSTQSIYRASVMNLYSFYAGAGGSVNLAALKQATKTYSKRVGKRLPNFDMEAIETVILYATGLQGDLLALRDRSFILTLADTGLRISEACALIRGDIVDGKAMIIGKGDKEAVIRFSDRSLQAIADYLRARAVLDGSSGKPLASLPLFGRHDKGAGKKVKPVDSGGMWCAVKGRTREAGVDPSRMRVHDLRHYFVSIILKTTGNLKLAQEFARHASIDMTARYAHFDGELDEQFKEIFNAG